MTNELPVPQTRRAMGAPTAQPPSRPAQRRSAGIPGKQTPGALSPGRVGGYILGGGRDVGTMGRLAHCPGAKAGERMKPREPLSDFVRDGLRAGHSPDELRAALERAGWPGAEIDAALSAWMDDGLRLPVPRPRSSVSGRELVMFGLFAITLVVVIWHLLQLSFALIEVWLPDPERPGAGWQAGNIRWSISVLLVALPLFAWLTWRVEAPSANGPPRSPLQVRFGAGAVLVSFLVLIGAAIAVVHAALSGEFTAQFLAKAVVVAGVAGVLIGWFRCHATEA